MRLIQHALDPSRFTSHTGRARRAAVVLAAASVTLFAVACQDSLSPLTRLVPTQADRLLVGVDTTNILAGGPERTHAVIYGLNNLGQTTGGFDPGGRQNEFTPFRWSPGSGFTNIRPLGPNTSYGTDINDAGVVVGVSSYGYCCGRAGVAVGTTMVNLGLLFSPAPEDPPPYPEGDSRAYAINNAGEIVGSSSTAISGGGTHAVLWNPARVIRDLGTLGGTNSRAIDINAAGQVIGMSNIAGSSVQHPFLWTASTGMQDLTAILGKVTNVVAINDRGQIAGEFTTAEGRTHAFVSRPNATLRDLGTLGGNWSVATGLNNRGQVVGASKTAAGVNHAFLWTEAEGMEDVTALTGIPEVLKLNDRLQTIAYDRFAGVPRLITLRIVARASQSIGFTSAAPSPALVGGTYVAGATATSGLPVSFASLSPSTCRVTGATVSFIAVGNCVVAADQSGNTSFRAAPRVTQSIRIRRSLVGFDLPTQNPPSFSPEKAGHAQ